MVEEEAPPLRVVISYSHEDASWESELEKHLRALERFHNVNVWSDNRVEPGSSWRDEMDKALSQADVVLILISASYLASELIHEAHVPRLVERHQQGRVCVIPMLLSSCPWEQHPWIGKVLPEGATPIAAFEGDGRNRALSDVAREIARIATARRAGEDPIRIAHGALLAGSSDHGHKASAAGGSDAEHMPSRNKVLAETVRWRTIYRCFVAGVIAGAVVAIFGLLGLFILIVTGTVSITIRLGFKSKKTTNDRMATVQGASGSASVASWMIALAAGAGAGVISAKIVSVLVSAQPVKNDLGTEHANTKYAVRLPPSSPMDGAVRASGADSFGGNDASAPLLLVDGSSGAGKVVDGQDGGDDLVELQVSVPALCEFHVGRVTSRGGADVDDVLLAELLANEVLKRDPAPTMAGVGMPSGRPRGQRYIVPLAPGDYAAACLFQDGTHEVKRVTVRANQTNRLSFNFAPYSGSMLERDASP